MKKNNRTSKYYDLTKNIGEYESSNSLIGWWIFNNKDSPSALQIPSSGVSSLPGKFVDSFDDQVVLGPSSFESPTFLKGLQHLNKASATVNGETKAFQITDFTNGQISSAAFTLSITFRMLQAYPQPIGAGAGDGKIHIATICDGSKKTGRLGLFFDSDGAGGSSPGISTVINRDDNSFKIWQTPLNYGNSRFKTVDHLRDWIRIDLVVSDITAASDEGWLRNNGAKLYINGLDASAALGTNGGTIAVSDISKLLIGGLDASFAGYAGKSSIQIGEAAIFKSALSSNEISYLYNNTRSSDNSGKLTNSPRSQLTCGECEHDSYPTIDRSTDWKRTGRRTPIFSDSDIFAIPAQTDVINYPTLLSSGSQADSAIGTILTNNNLLPTIETVVDTPSGSIGRSNIVRSYKKCNSTTDSSDIYKPFNEAVISIDVATRSSHMSEVLPGFTNTLGDRVIIDIDITPSSAKVLRVVTGSVKGETFGELDFKASEENTGLAYFNFVNGNFESIGSRRSEVGTRRNWNLPGEISSSVARARAGAEYITNQQFYKFANAPFLEDFKSVPRIFQPYSSIVAHRGTFNHVHATEFDSFKYFMGKARASPDPTALSTSLWHKLSPAGAATSVFTSPTTGLGYGGAGTQEFEWQPYSSDIAGRGWVTPGATVDPDNNLKGSRIWNDPGQIIASCWSQNLVSAFQSTLSTMGRPVAYTMWSKNSMFHASSSQTLKMNDYINTPMLLESFEVNASITSKRLLKPKIKLAKDSAATSYIASWSNTNNHIDCLTFFLLKQSSPIKANDNKPSSLADVEAGSRRELITYSNHIFASKYVGYDWLDRSQGVVMSTSYPALPYAGSRTSRVFEVKEDDILSGVPGTDSFSYYKDPVSGQEKSAYGENGIFFSNQDEHDVIGHPTLRDLDPVNHPQEVYVTSSIVITKNIPVRALGMYSQKSTPILPFVQSTWFRALSTYSHSPFFNAYADKPFFKAMPNVYQLQPRFTLSCMGTFWPGGSMLSDQQPEVSSIFRLYSASRGLVPLTFYEDNFTSPSSIAMFFKTGSKNSFPHTFANDIIAQSYVPSSRIIAANKGTYNIAQNQIGGQSPSAAPRTISPSLGLSHNSTFAISSSPSDNDLTSQANSPQPGFAYFENTGSFVRGTGYILQPKDELIFGAQWSPADAVHRSFKAISYGSKDLTFRGAGGQVSNFAGGVTETFGEACALSITPPEVGQQSYRAAGYCETNDLLMNASASCTIEKKPMTLRLYGTLLQNYSQKHHSLPQQLTTNCVHEVIGNEPILDIYDVSSVHDFSSSALSKNISGSMKSYSIYSMPSTSSGSNFLSPLIGRGVRGSIASSNLHDIGKLRRATTLIDISEYYYDSLAPNIDEMFVVDNAGPVTTSGSLQVQYGQSMGTPEFTLARTFYPILVNDHTTTVIQSGVTGSERNNLNLKFGRSFPFEPRYAGIERLFKQDSNAGYYFDSTTTSVLPTMYSSSLDAPLLAPRTTESSQVGFTPGNTRNGLCSAFGLIYSNPMAAANGSNKGYIENGLLLQLSQEKIVKSRKLSIPIRTGSFWPETYKLRDDFITGNYWINTGSIFAPAAGVGVEAGLHIANNFQIGKQTSLSGFFGVGNNSNGVLDHYYYYLTTLFLAGIGSYPVHASLLTQKPRGYRYGLISADPKRLSAVSRRDSYGQFRDILEQRQYSALFIDDPIDVAMNRKRNHLRRRKSHVTRPAVTCVFRTPVFNDPGTAGRKAKVSPAETNSSNLSNAATSSIPFFDGELRNRDAAPSPDTESIVL